MLGNSSTVKRTCHTIKDIALYEDIVFLHAKWDWENR